MQLATAQCSLGGLFADGLQVRQGSNSVAKFEARNSACSESHGGDTDEYH